MGLLPLEPREPEMAASTSHLFYYTYDSQICSMNKYAFITHIVY